MYILYYLAIIITGGGSSYFGIPHSVEVLRSNGSRWCSLADLPDDREDHTQSGLITCGGWSLEGSQDATCVTFSKGYWSISHAGLDDRKDHSSWSSSLHGTRLFSKYSSELLAETGQTPSSFSLKDYTT